MSTAIRRASVHGLATVRRERPSRLDCCATNAPLRFNVCQFPLGFASTNLRKNRIPHRRKSTHYFACMHAVWSLGSQFAFCNSQARFGSPSFFSTNSAYRHVVVRRLLASVSSDRAF